MTRIYSDPIQPSCNPKYFAIRRMYAEGKNCGEIGTELDYSEKMVKQIVREMGLDRATERDVKNAAN